MRPSGRHTFAILVVATLAAGGAWLAWPQGEDDAISERETVEGGPAAPPTVAHRRARRATQADSLQPVPPVAAPGPANKDAVIATLTGRVVDAVSGEPIAQAKLLWGYARPGETELQHAIWGRTTGDGSLSFVYPRTGWWAPDGKDDVAELWVAAPAYATAKIREPLSPVEVRLRPVGVRPPGDLRVHALRGDGTPWRGLVRVEAADDATSDHFSDMETHCAIADADGRCTLLGVPSRMCRVRLDDRVPWTPVAILPEGVVDVELRGAPPGPFAAMDASEVVARRDAAAKEMEDAKAKGDANRASEAEGVWKSALAELNNRIPAQRQFIVTNLPADAAPTVEVRRQTKDRKTIVWRQSTVANTVTFSTTRDGWHWWSIPVGRAGGVVEARAFWLLPARDGRVEAFVSSDGSTNVPKRFFPLRDDGALVVAWDQLVPDR